MPNVLDWMTESLAEPEWRDVPARAVAIYRALAPAARKIAAAHRQHDGPVYLNTTTGQVVPFTPPDGDWILVKAAAVPGEIPTLSALRRGFDALQTPLGGPHPLASTIAGGVLGSGLGYGAGWIGSQFLPEDHFDRGRFRRTLALLGGAAGAAPGLAWGATNMANPKDTGGGLQAWLSHWPRKEAAVMDNQGFLPNYLNDSGLFYTPTIPVDAFNQVVWADVQPPNPLGTKNPFGTNEQPLTTPAPVAATVSGIVSGAGAATGSPYVSPFHVGLTAAATAGTGYLAGMAAGKVLGALAGLRPEAQASLQRAGLWGGLLTGAMNALFQGR